MQALRVFAVGESPVLADLPVPAPGSGQVRLRVRACGLNFADLLMIDGRYQDTPDLPFTPGMEVAGVVDALGPGVPSPALGTRVAAFAGHGGLAQYMLCPASDCRPVPNGLDDVTAAGFQVAYGTSHLALTRRARLAKAETLVVLGAAGGVGLTAVEVGAALGARVIAVARGSEKRTLAARAGAEITLDATADLRAELTRLGGWDVLYDPVGGDAFGAALGAARPEARALVVGFAGGTVQQIPANRLLVKNVDVIGVYWGAYRSFAPDHLKASLDTLADWLADGRLAPHVGATFPLDRAAEGLDLLRNRKATGKVVVTLP